MYYPTQLAQEVLETDRKLKLAGEASFRSRWEEIEGEIRRDEHGKALPGQDDQMGRMSAFHMAEGPELFGSLDASRKLAWEMTIRAAAAAELVADHCRHTLSVSVRGVQSLPLQGRVEKHR